MKLSAAAWRTLLMMTLQTCGSITLPEPDIEQRLLQRSHALCPAAVITAPSLSPAVSVSSLALERVCPLLQARTRGTALAMHTGRC